MEFSEAETDGEFRSQSIQEKVRLYCRLYGKRRGLKGTMLCLHISLWQNEKLISNQLLVRKALLI